MGLIFLKEFTSKWINITVSFIRSVFTQKFRSLGIQNLLPNIKIHPQIHLYSKSAAKTALNHSSPLIGISSNYPPPPLMVRGSKRCLQPSSNSKAWFLFYHPPRPFFLTLSISSWLFVFLCLSISFFLFLASSLARWHRYFALEQRKWKGKCTERMICLLSGL